MGSQVVDCCLLVLSSGSVLRAKRRGSLFEAGSSWNKTKIYFLSCRLNRRVLRSKVHGNKLLGFLEERQACSINLQIIWCYGVNVLIGFWTGLSICQGGGASHNISCLDPKKIIPERNLQIRKKLTHLCIQLVCFKTLQQWLYILDRT